MENGMINRVVLTLAAFSCAFMACGSDEPNESQGGKAGELAGSGAGNAGGSVASAGSGAIAAPSGAGSNASGRNGTSGTAAPNAGRGGRSGAGAGAAVGGGAGRLSGDAGNAGSAVAAGSGGAAASSGATPPTASAEDDGADCTVAMLPETGALTANAKLPDPFKKLDGSRIASKADWRCRRAEIRKLAEKFAYGTKPAKPQMVTGTVNDTSIMINVSDGGKSTKFMASVKLPSGGAAPYPAIIVYGGGGFGAPLDTNVINSEGIALISYDPYAVGKEGTSRNNKQGAFYDIAGNTSTSGLLVAWAWGVSRIIDVIAASDGKVLKADAIGVTGCSRFGKGAFIAGVFDQRVALTLPIESGTAGVPIWRGIPGEGAQSLSSGYGEQPWFGDAFSAFTSDPTKAPIDTHSAVAMIAPRGLFIMDNPHIANLGPRSASVAALAGAEVYKALGAADAISYVSDVQNGNHCSVRPEWATPLKDNVQRFLKRTGSAPGVIKISSKATGKLSDWADWTAPTLN